eukprot:TRINITY_DN65895_c10_g4_i1.p1 TRINITY_DN65895_c10_g4~~TRINITY_DN65895_c10_g4_i1.p1  ORF type:complete len:399 (-),score=0.22 TRINITY_DN65895_c10_g4_i1:9-1205(-)
MKRDKLDDKNGFSKNNDNYYNDESLSRFEKHSNDMEQSGTTLARRSGRHNPNEYTDDNRNVYKNNDHYNHDDIDEEDVYRRNKNINNNNTKNSHNLSISLNQKNDDDDEDAFDLKYGRIDKKSPQEPDFDDNGLPVVALSYVLKAPKDHGRNTALVKCTIVREKESFNPMNMSKLYPTYQLILEETNKVILIAKKMKMNRTSNYHIFDMTRGHVSSNLTKKSGNYIGKLRARNYQRTEYSLLTQNTERKEEIAGVVFDRYGIYDQIKEGTQPRKISVIIPPLDKNNGSIPYYPDGNNNNNNKDDDERSMVDLLKSSEYGRMHIFESKDPTFEKGNYRLNFNGRVTVPSVKNFQLVPPTNINNVTCQFGKVGAEHFHLDYKAPLNAVQAFALALCQFNI